uniref:ABC transporter domain-containing protein n=1 Tax=Globisporangium ultimum (strain ATCC 200006 / CBS 805.95 / DAOM BR144) TaxID=431595 RepID=K3WZJ2_GLOUD
MIASDAPISQAKVGDNIKPQLEYTSGKELMAHGPHILNDHVGTRLEAALGRALPQMEIRFNHLSLTAEIAVASETQSKAELPTVTNELKRSFAGMLATKKVVHKEILKNVSGVFKPGTITLLLGQPGSGKSALMKILSGRFPVEKNITVEGEVTYNGQAQPELKKVLPQFVAYVNQRDKHYPTLTVKETLEYAHTFTGGELTRRGEELLSRGSPEENKAALEAAQAMFAHYPEVIIEQLGLQNCQDTIVGDAMLRGVSGGERKRVTTGEMEFGMKYVTLMDEISTGLDSAATFDIIKTQRSIAKKLRKTVVIALLQPSPEVFSLFDDVMILNAGEVMYHGPREQIVDYFGSLGFECPPGRDIADYLLDLGTREQRMYEVALPQQQAKHPRYPSEFAEVFRRSVILEVNANETGIAPVTLAFKDLQYSVPLPSNPKESIYLLKGITGYALPGTMTALMGSSGAGKTTLMDVIAGRKTGGKIQGQILLNGYEANDLAIRRSTGYCEQMDIHSESSTIREALTFSAFLRQDSSVPDSQKYDSVNECLDLLDLHDIADQIIRGSSVEQMKRLTIGVELAAQPSVLFLDEPTSGLDARSAKLIMDGVRKVANSGRTIVCTIHQPSSEVFFLFDSLLLLKRGGETVFFGDLGKNCRNLINYFESIPGVASLPTGYNPATWMLECIGAGVSNDAANDMDFVKYFNDSELKQSLDAELSKGGVGHIAPGISELLFSNKRASSSATQMRFLVTRFFDMYWRTASYTLTRFVLSLVLGLLFGLAFLDVDYDSYQGLNSGLGMVALAIIFNGFISLTSIIPMSVKDRASFYRERASQTYNAFWYFIGSTLVEIPYVFLSGLIFTAVFYPMVGFTGFGAAVQFWLVISLHILFHAYMGQLFAYAFPGEEVAMIFGILIASIFILFMGFNPPTNAIPSGYKWLYNITPHTYTFSIISALAFGDCSSGATYDSVLGRFVNVGSELGCQPLRNAPITLNQVTVKQYTEDVFETKHDDIGRNFAILVGMVVLLRVLALLALRFINHQKK